ncbi:glycosyltransferase family 4 protein [Streptomyces sp. NPDC058464]|uniref:glycosyltransferase family 4 protein n=1 Tax=Streptomyces sp. NPDC058464 TaxID=3346511 RepID=UPI003646B254
MERDRGREKKLCVALVHWAFPPCVGGVESHLWDYSRFLAEYGVDVTVLTGTPAPAVPCQGIRVEYHSALDLSSEGPPPTGEPPLKDWFRKCLMADAGTGGTAIRLVHGHNLHHFSSAPACALSELRDELGLRLLHTYHSVWWRQEGENARAVESCRGWDRHYAVSEFLTQVCRSRLGVNAECRYLGIDTREYLEVPVAGGRQEPGRVLLPARLIPDKGAMFAVAALRHLIDQKMGHPTPRLTLTDPSSTVDFHHEASGFRHLLEEQIAVLGLKDYVEFVHADSSQMRELYEVASVVLYPSVFDEPMGLAPLEAMCAGRPVVASRMGGLAEGIRLDERVGFLVPERNSHKLADRVALLLGQPGLAREMGARSREHVLRRFDMERVYLWPMIEEYWHQSAIGASGRGGGGTPTV